MKTGERAAKRTTHCDLLIGSSQDEKPAHLLFIVTLLRKHILCSAFAFKKTLYHCQLTTATSSRLIDVPHCDEIHFATSVFRILTLVKGKGTPPKGGLAGACKSAGNRFILQ